jgi:hypothetical protein
VPLYLCWVQIQVLDHEHCVIYVNVFIYFIIYRFYSIIYRIYSIMYHFYSIIYRAYSILHRIGSDLKFMVFANVVFAFFSSRIGYIDYIS